jgi:hypothetical protein
MKLAHLLFAALTAALCLQSSDVSKERRLEVGGEAPSFRLNDHRGDVISVGGERETWTVVAFYPKAMTPG